MASPGLQTAPEHVRATGNHVMIVLLQGQGQFTFVKLVIALIKGDPLIRCMVELGDTLESWIGRCRA